MSRFKMNSTSKLLLIGPSPGHGDPTHPLEGRVGAKLAFLCGISIPEYLNTFERTNLLEDWPGKQGKGDAFFLDEARKVADKIQLKSRMAVLLGKNVARAFRVAQLPWMTWTELRDGRIAVLPHPSGLNLWYNSPANRKLAQKFMKYVLKKAK